MSASSAAHLHATSDFAIQLDRASRILGRAVAFDHLTAALAGARTTATHAWLSVGSAALVVGGVAPAVGAIGAPPVRAC